MTRIAVFGSSSSPPFRREVPKRM